MLCRLAFATAVRWAGCTLGRRIMGEVIHAVTREDIECHLSAVQIDDSLSFDQCA